MDSTAKPAGGIFTVGHSNRSADVFLDLLKVHGVEELVDVRTAAGSRKFPQFGREELAAALSRSGIAYRHMPGLGGFRKTSPDSPNAGWKNASFRGYADYMQTPEFAAQLQQLMELATRRTVAIMCSEAVPWRCHRSLIADALSVRNVQVRHIMSEKIARGHRLTPFARVDGQRITYPPPLAGPAAG